METMWLVVDRAVTFAVWLSIAAAVVIENLFSMFVCFSAHSDLCKQMSTKSNDNAAFAEAVRRSERQKFGV